MQPQVHSDLPCTILVQILRPVRAGDFPSYRRETDTQAERNFFFINIDYVYIIVVFSLLILTCPSEKVNSTLFLVSLNFRIKTMSEM